MKFPCQATADTKLAFVTDASDACQYTLTYGTPHACPGDSGGGGSSSGLSGGWIFIIILLVGTFLYVVIGCVYKGKQLGATGMERCPQVDFWRELPGLAKEGCRFTWNKLRGLCGGGSTGTGGATGSSGYSDL